MEARQEYPVKLEVFEGPLDLLLYLIKRDEVDIYDIPISDITRQYNEYLNLMRMLDLDIAGEFIVMSASLMLIKSRMLLPEEERPDEEEEENDPRLDLVRQLVEYKKFKDVANHLSHLEEQQASVFWRSGAGVELEKDRSKGLQNVGLFDLINAFNEALRNLEQEQLQEIFTEEYTVAEKIDSLMQQLENKPSLSISSMFNGMKSRQEIICVFLAMLELMRLRHLRAEQKDGLFGEIMIVKNDPDVEEVET